MTVPLAPPEVLYPPWWVPLVWAWAFGGVFWVTMWIYKRLFGDLD